MAVAPHFHATAGSLWTGELQQESKQGAAAWVRLVPQQSSATTDVVVAMPQQFVSGGGFGQGLTAGGMRPRGRMMLARGGTGTTTSDGVRWWEKDGGPNFHDVHSTQEFVDALSNAGEKLVVAEFYAPWCGSCRALYPKLCKLAAEHLDVEFVKVNFEENKPMCKSLNIKVLPYFHFYRGAEGRLEDFSCSLSKLSKIRDAIALHNTDRCSLGPPAGAASLFTATGTGTDQAAAATASP